MQLGIIGLPTSGKTTIFNALTRSTRPTAPSSSGRLELVSAVVDVPDPRVDGLSAIYNPRRTARAKVTYTDIAGLDQDLGKTGLSGELRNKIAPLDGFVHVVRAFEDERVPHTLGEVDPQRDLDHLETEFLLADLIAVDARVGRIKERLSKGAKSEERQSLQEQMELFERLRTLLGDSIPLRDVDLTGEEEAVLRGSGLLTRKPVLVLVNSDEEIADVATLISFDHRASKVMAVQGKLEMELSQLPEDEVRAFMEEFGIDELALDRVIRASSELLDLLTFFTVSEEEVHAWTVPSGATALDAAAAVHTDLARGFIRAEVVTYDDLAEAGSMAAARKAAQVRVEGKDYQVQEGDVIYIRFSV